jgi:glucose/arabinose dehydrogenase
MVRVGNACTRPGSLPRVGRHPARLAVLLFALGTISALAGCDSAPGADRAAAQESSSTQKSAIEPEGRAGAEAVNHRPAAASAHGLPLDRLKLPEGFEIEVYTAEVPDARSMALSPSGVLYVGTRREGKVYAVVDRDGDRRVDRVVTVASGLTMPNGVAWRDGALYLAEVDRVWRYDGLDDRLDDPPRPVAVGEPFPGESHHGWKFIAFGPDGMLYVPVGAPCNVCESPPIFATITRMNADGSGREVFARGIRNTVGFDWQPGTGVLWFTDNGRDRLGDDVPPDELDRAPEPGLDFGFPRCHGDGIVDPEHGGERGCAGSVPPAAELGAHVAALGMRFNGGAMFPAAYRGQILFAEHGSWNRSRPVGFRVMRARLEGDAVAEVAPLVEGWLPAGATDGDQAWGRPVDVQELPDGSLLVSDDDAGAIYRITYGGRPRPDPDQT